MNIKLKNKNKRDCKHCVKHIKYNLILLRYESLIFSKNLILVQIERFSVV